MRIPETSFTPPAPYAGPEFAVALGPLDVAVADELATAVSGCSTVCLEGAGPGLLDPGAKTYNPYAAAVVDRLNAYAAASAPVVSVVDGNNPGIGDTLGIATTFLRAYTLGILEMSSNAALSVLQRNANYFRIIASDAFCKGAIRQIYEQTGTTDGKVGLVLASGHYAVAGELARRGTAVSTTVIGEARLPYGHQNGDQTVRNMHGFYSLPRPAAEIRALENRVLLSDQIYTPGVLLPPDRDPAEYSAYDRHLTLLRATRLVEGMDDDSVRTALDALDASKAIGRETESREPFLDALRGIIDAAQSA